MADFQLNRDHIGKNTEDSIDASRFLIGSKLSIKLDDQNFLLWNQQMEEVITSHKLHPLLVNPEIPQKYDSENDRLIDRVSDAYNKWLVKDQTLFHMVAFYFFRFSIV